MKIGNVAKHLDLSKPFTQDDIRKALAKAQAEQKPMTIRQVAKAGYGLRFMVQSPIAAACGANLPALPQFVKE